MTYNRSVVLMSTPVSSTKIINNQDLIDINIVESSVKYSYAITYHDFVLYIMHHGHKEMIQNIHMFSVFSYCVIDVIDE